MHIKRQSEKKTQLLEMQLCSAHKFSCSLFLNEPNLEICILETKISWGPGEVTNDHTCFVHTCTSDCKVMIYLTFMYLCIMYVIAARGFFYRVTFLTHSNKLLFCAHQAYEHLQETLQRGAEQMKTLLFIRKYYRPHASLLNHYVSFLSLQALNTLSKRFLSSFCISFCEGSWASHEGSLIRTPTWTNGKPEHNEVFQLMSAWSTKGMVSEGKEKGRKMVEECIKNY